MPSMRAVRLGYRDHDRTLVIYCIKVMAERHYDIHMKILHIEKDDWGIRGSLASEQTSK